MRKIGRIMLPFYRTLSHERSTFMTQNHQHFQRNQQQHTYQPHESHRPPPRNPRTNAGNFSGGSVCDWNYRCKRCLRAVRASPGSGSTCRRGKQLWETNSPGWPARWSLLVWWESASFPLKGCTLRKGAYRSGRIPPPARYHALPGRCSRTSCADRGT